MDDDLDEFGGGFAEVRDGTTVEIVIRPDRFDTDPAESGE